MYSDVFRPISLFSTLFIIHELHRNATKKKQIVLFIKLSVTFYNSPSAFLFPVFSLFIPEITVFLMFSPLYMIFCLVI